MNNEDIDHAVHYRSQFLSYMSIVTESEIPRLLLSSLDAQPGVNLTSSHLSEDRFSNYVV